MLAVLASPISHGFVLLNHTLRTRMPGVWPPALLMPSLL
jgi:hypothetical protein